MPIRSYRQARLALRLPAQSSWDDTAIRFDDLGVYRLLVGIEDLGEVERFVQRWLGPLLEYDARRGSELVRTLAHRTDRLGADYNPYPFDENKAKVDEKFTAEDFWQNANPTNRKAIEEAWQRFREA